MKRVFRAMLSVGVLLLGPTVFSDDGLQLFHKMQKALGGADKIAAIREFEQQVRAQSWNGNTGRLIEDVTKRTRWIRPNYLRVDQVGPGSTYVLYFDGKSGWEILPGTQNVIELAGGELTFAQNYVRTFTLNLWLADRDPTFRISSPSPNVVRIADGDLSHQHDITLDPASWLPVKTNTMSGADPAQPVPREEVVTEWETVQGIRFARHWTVFRSRLKVAEATLEFTKLNGGLKLEDLAAKPGDSKPVLSSR
jgi:hypothetical protein